MPVKGLEEDFPNIFRSAARKIFFKAQELKIAGQEKLDSRQI
jgi:hypothetical protein